MLQIDPRPCRSTPGEKETPTRRRNVAGAEGEVEGVCMFNFECSQRGGHVIGTCIDRFLFGACCFLPEGAVAVFETSTQRVGDPLYVPNITSDDLTGSSLAAHISVNSPLAASPNPSVAFPDLAVIIEDVPATPISDINVNSSSSEPNRPSTSDVYEPSESDVSSHSGISTVDQISNGGVSESSDSTIGGQLSGGVDVSNNDDVSGQVKDVMTHPLEVSKTRPPLDLTVGTAHILREEEDKEGSPGEDEILQGDEEEDEEGQGTSSTKIPEVVVAEGEPTESTQKYINDNNDDGIPDLLADGGVITFTLIEDSNGHHTSSIDEATENVPQMTVPDGQESFVTFQMIENTDEGSTGGSTKIVLLPGVNKLTTDPTELYFETKPTSHRPYVRPTTPIYSKVTEVQPTQAPLISWSIRRPSTSTPAPDGAFKPDTEFAHITTNGIADDSKIPDQTPKPTLSPKPGTPSPQVNASVSTTAEPLLIWTLYPQIPILEVKPSRLPTSATTPPNFLKNKTDTSHFPSQAVKPPTEESLLTWTTSPKPSTANPISSGEDVTENKPFELSSTHVITTSSNTKTQRTTSEPDLDDPLAFWTTIRPYRPPPRPRPTSISTPSSENPLLFWTTTKPSKPQRPQSPSSSGVALPLGSTVFVTPTSEEREPSKKKKKKPPRPSGVPGDVIDHLTDLLKAPIKPGMSSEATTEAWATSTYVIRTKPNQNTSKEASRVTTTQKPTTTKPKTTTITTPITTTSTTPSTTTTTTSPKPTTTKPRTTATPKTTIKHKTTPATTPRTTTTSTTTRPKTTTTTLSAGATPIITTRKRVPSRKPTKPGKGRPRPTTDRPRPISPVDQFIDDFINSSPPKQVTPPPVTRTTKKTTTMKPTTTRTTTTSRPKKKKKPPKRTTTAATTTTSTSTTPMMTAQPPIDLELLAQLLNLTNFIPEPEILPPIPPTKSSTTSATTTTTTPRPKKKKTPVTRKPTTTTTTPTTTTTTPTTTTTTTTTTKAWDYRKDCGVRPLVREGRIVNGERSDLGEWPWQVLIKESTWLGIFTKNKCGGVLLNSRYVITAAHCQPGFLASLIVILGEFDLTGDYEPKDTVQRNVKRVVVHRGYVAKTFDNDLALLEMERPVTFDEHIVPICLPSGNPNFIGEIGTVTGWGRLSYNGPVPTQLNEVQVPIIRNKECQQWFIAAGHVKSIKPEFLCAGYKDGKKDSCEGDSGGPLAVRGKDGRWVLAGTVSHGIKCAYPNLPGVYMRMTYYKPWIESIIY